MLTLLWNDTINKILGYETPNVDDKCKQKLCVRNCGQISTDSDMVTIEY